MSLEKLNEIKSQISELTASELRELTHFLLEQSKHKQLAMQQLEAKRKIEREWVETHRQEFQGQWVALDGDRLLSHGLDGKVVFAEAHAAGVDLPFVTRVEPPDTPPFGGW